MKDETQSIAGSGGIAADVTGLTRVCSDLASRVDEFVRRVDAIKDNIGLTHDCCQLIDMVLSHISFWF